MGDMHHPEHPDDMVKPMQPVEQEIFRQQEGKPVDPGSADLGNAVVPAMDQYYQIKSAEQQIDSSVQEHHQEIVQYIPKGVISAVFVMTEQDLPQNDQHIERRGP